MSFRRISFFAALVIQQLLGIGRQDAVAVTAAETAPKIAAVRVGLAGHYKVGFWTPVWVETEGTETLADAHVAVTVVDSDAVATTASAPVQKTASNSGRMATVIYTKIGRIGGSIRVELIDGDRQLDEFTLRPGNAQQQDASAMPLPSTAELVIALSTTPVGLSSALPDRQAADSQLARRTVELNKIEDLPTEWYGYEAVDVLTIAAGDGKICEALAADNSRFAAVLRWVDLGGRLVIMCDGAAAEKLLMDGGALTKLAPGKLAEVVRLTDTGPLEHFSGSATQISSSDMVNVPRLMQVAGNIDAYGGQQPADLPLVVRTVRGLGEVAFAGVDVSKAPLVAWPGRTALLQSLLRPYLPEDVPSDATQRLVSRGYDDLSGALRQQLGKSFALVVPIGFPIVAVAAIAYMLMLGPGDYLIVNRWIRKPLAAWITFPLIVLLFGIGAVGLAEWRKGSGGPRVNRLELVDVDTIFGTARGTFWAVLYSPRAERFDLTVDVPEIPHTPSSDQQPTQTLLSWWGLPGVGIGGMHASGAESGIIRSGYYYGDDGNSLEQVPILSGATKSFLARWTAPAGPMVTAELSDQDGLLAGFVINETGRELRNARLLYGTWAYKLGTIKAGERFEIGDELSPRQVKTIVTRDALGDGASATGESAGKTFIVDQASAKELLSLMMFYEAAGANGFAQLPNRFQSYCDLSRLLVLGRAILVADAPVPSSQLIDKSTGRPLGDELDSSTTVYRFLLPVEKKQETGRQGEGETGR